MSEVVPASASPVPESGGAVGGDEEEDDDDEGKEDGDKENTKVSGYQRPVSCNC
jgi:hypothetical protein